MSLYIPEIEEQVKEYTDANGWYASWHWEREQSSGALTIDGAKKMLADLNCDGRASEEITHAVNMVNDRYALADRLRDIIAREELQAIADTHDEGCTCDICKQVGYA